ncbi:MAG: hypothetical protein ACXVZI_08255, partial [Terriglobales bacterium]
RRNHGRRHPESDLWPVLHWKVKSKTSMKRNSEKDRQEVLDALEALPDDHIDTSDISELTDEQLRRAVRRQKRSPVSEAGPTSKRGR